MKLKRKNIVSLLFATVFLMYVLSPLMFHLAVNNYNGIVPSDYKTASSSETLHILFEKLICIKFTSDAGDKDHSSAEIIIHKARTIIPEDQIVKLTLLHNMSITKGNLPDFIPEESGQFRPIDDEERSESFQLSSSDLSPPTA
ncbi:MAG: hypothetical protein ACLPN1_09090 [Dissulfurispiraceae bacterium]|jgi:hypothetical protein